MRRALISLAVLAAGLIVALAVRVIQLRSAGNSAPGGSGVIEGVDVDVTSRLATRIVKVDVREGDVVKRDQAVVELDCTDQDAALAQTRAELAAAGATVDASRATATSVGRSALAAVSDVAAATSQLAVLESQERLAKIELGRTERLVGTGALAPAALDAARAHTIRWSARSRRSTQPRPRHATRPEQRGPPVLPRKRRRSSPSTTWTSLRRRCRAPSSRSANARCSRRAAGMVATRVHEPGEAVQPGTIVLTITDLTEARTRFYLPNDRARRRGARAQSARCRRRVSRARRSRGPSTTSRRAPSSRRATSRRARTASGSSTPSRSGSRTRTCGCAPGCRSKSRSREPMTAARIEAIALRKSFGAPRARRTLSLARRRRRDLRAGRPRRRRQDDRAADPRGAARSGRRSGAARRAGPVRAERRRARGARLHAAAVQPLRRPHRRREPRVLSRDVRPAREAFRTRASACSRSRGSPPSRPAAPRRSRAACTRSSPSRARCCTSRRCFLLDEPTNGVDPVSRREFWDLLREFLAEGMAIVIATPYMDEAARCHRVGPAAPGPLARRRRAATTCSPRSRTPSSRSTAIATALEAAIAHDDDVLAFTAAGEHLQRRRAPRQRGRECSPSSRRSARTASPAAATFEDLFLVARARRQAAERAVSATLRPSPCAGSAARSATFVAVRDVSFEVARRRDLRLPRRERRRQVDDDPHPLRPARRLRRARRERRRASTSSAIRARCAARSATCRSASRSTSISSVRENLAFFGGAYGLLGARLARAATRSSARSSSARSRDEITGSLPGGLRQRLALACAILHRAADRLPRRAHRGRRPGRAAHVLAAHPPARRERHDHLRHHALHGRGRVLRSRRPDGRRPPRGARHAGALKRTFVPGRMLEVRGVRRRGRCASLPGVSASSRSAPRSTCASREDGPDARALPRRLARAASPRAGVDRRGRHARGRVPAPSSEALREPRPCAARAAIAHKEVLHIIRDVRVLYLALGLPVVMLLLFGYGISTDVDHIADRRRRPGPHARVPATRRGAGRRGPVRRARLGSRTRTQAEPLFRRGRASGGARDPARLPARPAARRADRRAAPGRRARQLDGDDRARRRARHRSSRSPVRGAAPRHSAAIRTRFNPAMRSAYGIVPGVIALILSMVSALLTALTVAREWERGSMEQLFATPVRRAEIIVGKLLPYAVLGMVQTLLVVTLGSWMFDVPIRGSLALLFFCSLLVPARDARHSACSSASPRRASSCRRSSRS